MNEQPWVGAALIGVCVVVTAVMMWTSSREVTASLPSKMYFSDDDGKTYFADDSSKIPPFTRDGKTAYLAGVYQCQGQQPFVAYLFRYTLEGKGELERFSASKRNSSDEAVNRIKMSKAELKAPGEKSWIKPGDEFEARLKPGCPPGATGIPAPAYPK